MRDDEDHFNFAAWAFKYTPIIGLGVGIALVALALA